MCHTDWKLLARFLSEINIWSIYLVVWKIVYFPKSI